MQNTQFNSPFMEFSLLTELRRPAESPDAAPTVRWRSTCAEFVTGEQLGQQRHLEMIQPPRRNRIDWNPSATR